MTEGVGVEDPERKRIEIFKKLAERVMMIGGEFM
jgi:hypothetical protein